MKEETGPPFVAGDKLICVNPALFPWLKKGDIYEAIIVFKCPCGNWVVNVGVGGGNVCASCEKEIKFDAMNASLFRKIESQYEDCTASIAASLKQTDETPDRIQVPEKFES